MKKIIGVVLVFIMAIFGFVACNGNSPTDNGGTVGNGNSGSGNNNPPVITTNNILIAYFSCTNTTEAIANHIQTETKGKLYEIVPEVPYTAEDLQYYTGGRADQEQADATARPAISSSIEDLDKYNVIFLGYPIWHGQAPRIIYTFLESYDFSGKTIVPFCTSHSSGIGSSDTNLHSLTPNAEWVSGRRFSSGASQKTVADWIDSLDIKLIPNVATFDLENGENGCAPTIMLNSGYEMPVLGIGTYSLHGETCVNSVLSALESGVRLIDTAYMYGNEKEVGEAIRSSGIPREDIFVITKSIQVNNF
ncbi:MAG: aldo/keto reductase [Anaeroplasmataceae bacterium]|nr:aldo/keto reductase [Anaeroplasmataceae bacterium]